MDAGTGGDEREPMRAARYANSQAGVPNYARFSALGPTVYPVPNANEHSPDGKIVDFGRFCRLTSETIAERCRET